MTIFQYLIIGYLLGGVATSRVVLRVAETELEKSIQSNKSNPETLFALIAITKLVSLVIWPIVFVMWMLEVATRRVKPRK